MIQLNDENTVFVLFTDQIQKHLETLAIEVRELVEEVFSCGRFHHAVKIGRLELPLHFASRLDNLGGELAPTDKQA